MNKKYGKEMEDYESLFELEKESIEKILKEPT